MFTNSIYIPLTLFINMKYISMSSEYFPDDTEAPKVDCLESIQK